MGDDGGDLAGGDVGIAVGEDHGRCFTSERLAHGVF
jgi:hypothetical protein